MSTGTASTDTYTTDPGVLRSGEVLEPIFDPELLKDPNTKIYYHATKGAVTHLPDGMEIQFRGGMFATNNADAIAYLDKIADKPGTQVFTKKETELAAKAENEALAESARAPTGDAAKNLTVK